MIVRIYTGDDGQSHFEEQDMESGPYPWGELREATGVIFNRSQPGSFSDWHNVPRRQLVITLSGAMEIGIVDGQGDRAPRLRTRLLALAAVLVNRSGTPTLRYPARWPWATQFHTTLSALRALPGPSG